MLEALGNDPKGGRLYQGYGFVPVLAVAHDARQCWHFGKPSAVSFAFDFNRKRHGANVPSGLSNKAMVRRSTVSRSKEQIGFVE